MSLTPWNRQEEWYQQMINAATGKYLPSITSQDAGKVMTVESDGSWGVENIPSELPSVTSADETKVLTVDSNGDWVAGDAPSGLPSTNSASAGDVLSLNNSKEAVWTTPSSGGGVLSVSVVTSGTELFSGTLPDVTGYAWRSSIVGHKESYYVDFACDLSEATYNALSAVIGDVNIAPINVSYSDGTVTLKVGTNSGIKSGYTSEEEISGKTLVLYADAETRLDKTWQEIKDAPVAIIEREETELGQTTYTTFWKEQIGFETGAFYVAFMEHTNNEPIQFVASSASDYPTHVGE